MLASPTETGMVSGPCGDASTAGAQQLAALEEQVRASQGSIMQCVSYEMSLCHVLPV